MISKKKNKILQTALIIFALLLITFIICMKSPLNPFTQNLEEMLDSGVFRYIGWRMHNNEVPYRDIFDHKGPLIYFINYLGIAISYDKGIWLIEYLFIFVSLLLTYKIFCKFTGKVSSLIATLLTFVPMYSYFEGGNYTEEYALPFILLGLYIFIDFFKESEKYVGKNKFINWKIVLSGISCACILFLRQNMIALWLVFCIATIIFCIKKKFYKELFRFIVSFLIGIIIITVPIIIYLIVNQAFDGFIKDYFIFNFAYSSVSLVERASSIFIFLVNDNIILLLVIMIIKIIYNIIKRMPVFFEVSYLIYMVINIILVCISGRAYYHYGITLIPAYIYPFCILFCSLESIKLNKLKTYIIGYILLVFIVPTWIKYLKDTFNVITIYQEEKVVNNDTKDLIEYIKENTYENEEIIIYGHKNSIYNLTKTKSASKYSYIIDKLLEDENFMKNYLLELKEKNPKLIILINSPVIKSDRMKVFLVENHYYQCNQFAEIDVYCLKED